jgi:hypothetical protein
VGGLLLLLLLSLKNGCVLTAKLALAHFCNVLVAVLSAGIVPDNRFHFFVEWWS